MHHRKTGKKCSVTGMNEGNKKFPSLNSQHPRSIINEAMLEPSNEYNNNGNKKTGITRGAKEDAIKITL